ncbi:regulatory protein, arsR family [Salinibacillus kushneri]|uniref:Regulatory protein, arsR family n=1 Tax=Salinibacillus kushneri TaxID=237682 RepID=A0A1I0GIA8_9BACI|nr:winged helix-turn-helix domain-containing protein [Salinibacillus kushneri]SET70682.1 regulatory protein, arsR family [Salinibacillus kushneri]
MDPYKIIKEYEQLKTLGDPFRSKLIMRLIEKPYTGQQLSEIFNLSRARVHYHLRELEKHGFIQVIRKEEKNGIIQKFYQSVAKGFVLSDELLPHAKEISNATRQIMFETLDRTRTRILTAPDDAFKNESEETNPANWKFMSSQWELKTTEDKFKVWAKKYYELMHELGEMSREEENNPEAKSYYFLSMAFQMEEGFFKQMEQDENQDDDE